MLTKVVLTGFMGAGKTEVGEILASRIGIPFFDLDREVEDAAGATIREIFLERGESGFRALERSSLRRLLRHERAVIAAGGGTLSQPGVAEEVSGRAVTVWLDTPLEVIEGRLRHAERDARPLFGDVAAVRDLYRRRLPTYRRSDFRIEIDGRESPSQVVERVVKLLEENRCATS